MCGSTIRHQPSPYMGAPAPFCKRMAYVGFAPRNRPRVLSSPLIENNDHHLLGDFAISIDSSLNFKPRWIALLNSGFLLLSTSLLGYDVRSRPILDNKGSTA